MPNPKHILEKFQTELLTLNEELNKTLASEQLAENDVERAIDYLNEMIRKLDHTVENLLMTRSKTT